MTFNPKVSIVIPVYNGANYLREAIDSALAQTYKNIEVIVVNDGSNDGGQTEAIAKSYGDKIKYYFKENGGVASALNLGIEKMTGEYFSWLSHDDVYYPEKVSAQIQALSGMEWPRTILYSDYSVFSNNVANAKEIRLTTMPPELFRYFITINNALHGCTLLVPKVAFTDCGIFDEGLLTTQDYDLWFRLAEKYRFVHLPLVLVKARHHERQCSIKMKDLALAECNTLFSGFISKLSKSELTAASDKSLSLSYARISSNLRRHGFYQAARYASGLARQNLTQSSWADALMSLAILLYSALRKWISIGIIREH